MSTIDRPLVSVAHACEMLGGIGRTNLYQRMSSGELESVKIGKRRLIRVSSIHALIDKAGEEL